MSKLSREELDEIIEEEEYIQENVNWHEEAINWERNQDFNIVEESVEGGKLPEGVSVEHEWLED